MDKYQFGEFIYQKRKQLHMTQDELGRKLGVTNKAVSKWETGETLPDIQLLELLASTLDVTIDELLTQRKPATEEVAMEPKKPIMLCSLFGSIILVLVITVIVLSVNLAKDNELELEPSDIYSVIDISPCVRSEVNGTTLTIYSTVVNHSPNDVTFTAEFTIKYYYQNTNDGISIITYERKLDYDGTTSDYCFVLRPKSEPEDFLSYLSFEIDYKIKSYEM